MKKTARSKSDGPLRSMIPEALDPSGPYNPGEDMGNYWTPKAASPRPGESTSSGSNDPVRRGWSSGSTSHEVQEGPTESQAWTEGTPATNATPENTVGPTLQPTLVTNPNEVVPSPAWDAAQTRAAKTMYEQKKDALSVNMAEVAELYAANGMPRDMVPPASLLKQLRKMLGNADDDNASVASAGSVKSAHSTASSWTEATMPVEESNRAAHFPMTPRPPDEEEDQQPTMQAYHSCGEGSQE